MFFVKTGQNSPAVNVKRKETRDVGQVAAYKITPAPPAPLGRRERSSHAGAVPSCAGPGWARLGRFPPRSAG